MNARTIHPVPLLEHFDPSTGVADGEPTLVADSVFNPGGPVGYTVSGAGLLVYQQRPYLPQRVWLDRRGTPLDSVPDDEAWTSRHSWVTCRTQMSVVQHVPLQGGD